MAFVQEIQHRGIPVLVYDFRAPTREDALARIQDSRGAASTYPPNSIRTMVDVTNCFLDEAVVRAFGTLAAEDAPHVLAAAVVGSHGPLDQARQMIAGLTRRSLEPFATESEALDWLVMQ